MQVKSEREQIHARSSIIAVLRGRDTMLLILAWAAGCVDALAYLGLDHVFVANMTGNTVLLGLALGQGRIQAAVRSVASIVGFALGVAGGALIVDRSDRQKEWPLAVTAALIVEALLLGLLTFAWYLAGTSPSTLAVGLFIGLAAISMGIQSAAVRRLDVAGIATTYITGTITNLMYDLVDWLCLAHSPRRLATLSNTTKPTRRKPALRLEALVWLAYGTGASISVFAASHWQALAILLPLAALITVIINSLPRTFTS